MPGNLPRVACPFEAVLPCLHFHLAATALSIPGGRPQETELTLSAAPGPASRIDRLSKPLGSLRRSVPAKLAIPAIAIALVVGTLLVGLPVKQAAGNQLPTFDPIPPSANVHPSATNVALDAPFQIQFNKPMSAPSVEQALTIAPAAAMDLRWDATDQTLALRPKAHWEPFTTYTVKVGNGAVDLEGLALASPVTATFETGALTSGEIKATQMVGSLASPRTAFQITFTRPVKFATVAARLNVYPATPVKLSGDDPTDQESTVFTVTPESQLATGTKYLLTMTNGGADSSGSSLMPVKSLEAETLPTPAVVHFTPAGGSVSRDTNQAISVTFSVSMDPKATATALRITSNDRVVAGNVSWSDDDTVITWTPRRPFATGAVVGISVGTGARSVGGISVAAAQSVNFSIAKARATRIAYKPPTQIKWNNVGPQYLSAERYYLDLMNCTRTGGWVEPGGYCGSNTHHTKPAQKPLSLNAGISDKVARPFAKYLADTCQLNHYINGTPRSRLAAAGYGSGSWGENIASPGGLSAGSLAAVEIYFQNESRLRGNNHYTNIMSKYFRSAGIGIWISRCTRLAVDFYG